MLLEVGEVEEEDSRELRGRIRIATMMPSSVPLLLLVVSVGEVVEGASLVDIVPFVETIDRSKDDVIDTLCSVRI